MVLSLFLVFLIFGIMMNSPMIFAVEGSEELGNPGITPDSFLWGIDKALEQISLLLATSPETKATKGLEIAHERLLEVKAMAQENKLDAVAKAENAHSKALAKVKENIQSFDEEDPESEIKIEFDLERKLKNHEKEIEKVNAELRIKIKIEGTLNEEQQMRLEEFLNSLKNNVDEVEIEIKNKKDKTKIRIREKTGKSEEDIEREFETEIEVKAEIINGQVQVKIENEFSVNITDRELIIDEIINRFSLTAEDVDRLLKIETEEDEGLDEERLRAEVEVEEGVTEIEVELRFILNTIDRELIVSEIVSRSQLTNEQINEILEFEVEEEDELEEESEEIEIEVEIEKGIAKVKMKIKGAKTKFVLETTNQEIILQEIASRLGVSVEDILDFVEFDIEDEDEEDNDEEEDDENDDNDEEEDEEE